MKQEYKIILGMLMTAIALTILIHLLQPLPAKANSIPHPLKKNADGRTQELIRLAWNISNQDKTFILLIEGESGFNPWATGGLGEKTLCQLLPRYHKEFIYSANYQIEYQQLKYCYDVYQDAIKKKRLKTTFYGLYREGLEDRFIW